MNVKESCIEWIRGDMIASGTFPNGTAHKNRIIALSKSHPEDVQITAENKDGSICARFPVSFIKINAPRSMTDEQRELAAERFKERMSNKKSKESTSESEE